jgi:hypothetical protein
MLKILATDAFFGNAGSPGRRVTVYMTGEGASRIDWYALPSTVELVVSQEDYVLVGVVYRGYRIYARPEIRYEILLYCRDIVRKEDFVRRAERIHDFRMWP